MFSFCFSGPGCSPQEEAQHHQESEKVKYSLVIQIFLNVELFLKTFPSLFQWTLQKTGGTLSKLSQPLHFIKQFLKLI